MLEWRWVRWKDLDDGGAHIHNDGKREKGGCVERNAVGGQAADRQMDTIWAKRYEL